MKKNIMECNWSAKPIVIKGKSDNPIYDMYYLEITYDTGEKETIKLFSEHGTIDMKISDMKIQKYFFVDRLFGENGLIKKQGRKDYIFLGRLEKGENGEYKANRHYLMSNKKETAQQYFDRCYEKIEEVLEKKNKQREEKINGKNYVCSDIHGMYGSYIDALKQLKSGDHLWILGDAIDRGKYGIKIIQDIMRRPQVTYILGNHDALFINVIDMMKKYNITNAELKEIIKLQKEKNEIIDLIIQMKNDKNNSKSGQELEIKINKLKMQLQALIRRLNELQNRKKVSKGNMDFIEDYSSDEGAFHTIWGYATLSEKQQSEMYEFLINSHIISERQISDKKIILTHAQPPESDLEILTFKQAREKYGNAKVINFLQERGVDERYKKWYEKGYTTICGHTPSPNEIIDESKIKGFIRIDAGCSRGCALALYCIEDETIKFIPAKEQSKDGSR